MLFCPRKGSPQEEELLKKAPRHNTAPGVCTGGWWKRKGWHYSTATVDPTLFPPEGAPWQRTRDIGGGKKPHDLFNRRDFPG